MSNPEESRIIAERLAALGHEVRLQLFRLLVRAGAPGLSVGEIGDHMKMPASTLAHHLASLVQAGLVFQERQGRKIINRVDFAAMRGMMDFLTEQCCTGVTLVSDDAA
jgi:DNA-binding transcriptional ArsR family regulator